MDKISPPLQDIFRWLHIIAGIMWIGLLYFFNFVNGPFAKTLDGDSKKKVVPELLPRALYWFRWGAAWTWATGVLLLLLIFYHGKQVLNPNAEGDLVWNAGIWVMLAVTFAAVFLYDAILKSPLAGNVRVAYTVLYLILGAVVYLFVGWAQMSYRGFVIHTGALFGTIMAFNVWFRIWPAQQKIITAIKNGEAPDGGLVALAGLRSRHNTYLSVPLVWAMINSHTTYWAGGNLGITSDTAWMAFMLIILVGWHIVWILYKKAGKVQGF